MPGAEDPKLETYPQREPTPEERDVGSDDPDAQAKAILDAAAERAELTRHSPGVERRESQDTVDMTSGVDTGETHVVRVSETSEPAGA